MKFNNKVYDILKWVAMVGLYGLAVLMSGLGEIWHIPYTNEIVKTITLVGTVLGILLGISNINYNKKNK
jgi:hypothetical protein